MNRDEFIDAFFEFFERAISLSNKARREGLLSLEEEIDVEKVGNRDIFEYGLRFGIDGADRDLINGILSNIINQEKDEYKLMLKRSQAEAVLSIQAGDNPRMLVCKLNSFTDIPISDARFQKWLE